MGDTAETAASRLWRDRAQLREQERNEALARAQLAKEQVVVLTAENDRLASKNTHLRDQNDRLAVEIARLGTLNDRLAAEIALLRTRLVPDAAHVRPRSAAVRKTAAISSPKSPRNWTIRGSGTVMRPAAAAASGTRNSQVTP